ncbi:MBL fold metallo-hydrolase [Spiroplasma chrysopicola]|uniref:Hydrolase n=1 Tax=Spiroplasma chrysopicola DF-1 TaxID=1276227 RepID=R4UIZ3_9MOLU|nr:MBL fold metallo-hydrolase [Spiroplasma chrysopicola]AGM25281.1 hydrolase [Spiroplasma chrysopicola DF-1]
MAKMKNFIDQTYDNQNVYLIINDANEAIMIDASNAAKEAVEYLAERNINLKALFISHGHIDHFDGLDFVLAKYPDIKIYLQRSDEKLLAQKRIDDITGDIIGPVINYPLVNLELLDGNVTTNDIGYEVEVFSAPGHTKGTQLLRIKKLNLITTGFSLLPDCNAPGYTGKLCNNQYFVKELVKMTNLEPQWHVLPGHNKSFTIQAALAAGKISPDH